MRSTALMNRGWVLLCLLIGCVQPQQSAVRKMGISVWEELQRGALEQQQLTHTAPIRVDGRGDTALISVEGENLDLEPLLSTILSETGIPFLYDLCEPTGKISLKLNQVPCKQALTSILSQAGYHLQEAQMGGQIVSVISDGAPLQEGTGSKERVYKQFEVHQANLNSLTSSLLLGKSGSPSLWPAGNTQGMAISTSPESNRIFLTGPAEDVHRTLQILQKSDQSSSSILLDCLLVVLQEKLELDLFAQIDFSSGPLTLNKLGNTTASPFIDPTALPTSGVINATIQGTGDNPLLIQATNPALTALLTRAELRRAARSQLLIQPNQSGYLQVGRNGYILISTLSDGQPSVDTQQIIAGSQLSFTPILLPGGQIRVNFDLTLSRFADRKNLRGNIFSVASKSAVQVAYGEPIVIGGLRLHNSGEVKQGYAGFRNLPVADWLTEASQETHDDRWVMLIIVPKVMKGSLSLPGINTPIRIPLLDSAPGVLNTRDVRVP